MLHIFQTRRYIVHHIPLHTFDSWLIYNKNFHCTISLDASETQCIEWEIT